MSMTSLDLINTLRKTQLNDPEGTTWDNEQLVIALNQALLTLVLVRPDATAEVATIILQAGTRQLIPSDGVRMIRAVKNINIDGSDGVAVRLVQMEDIDGIFPDWHTADGRVVSDYMFDIRSPMHFYIYPRVIAGSKLEIEYSKQPILVTVDTLNRALPVNAIYSQPLQELMLYSLLSGDSINGNTGAAHLQTAMELLGVKDKADERASSAKRSNI